MTNKNKRKQKKAQQQAAAQATSSSIKASTTQSEILVKTAKVDSSDLDSQKDENRPIRGWNDVLDLAAEYGLVPVGPTVQSGLNFAAEFKTTNSISLGQAANRN